MQAFLRVYVNPTFSWDDVAFVRAATRLPLVLKGILHPADARLAADRGADVLKALALGARAVLWGWPYAFAPVARGEPGVRPALRSLLADVDLELALGGRASMAEVDRTLLGPQETRVF